MFRVQGVGFRVQGLGYILQGIGLGAIFRVLKFRVQDSGCKV